MTDNDITLGYGFNNLSAEGKTQLQHLAEVLDPHSISVLSTAGVTPGMQCLDIGPGAGTITRWLADQVTPAGHVTAIDTEPMFASSANIVMRHEDIRDSQFEPASLDLIHARLVLMHLPERREVLARLATWLRPGGVIVLSEWDCTYLNLVRHSPTYSGRELHDTFQTTLIGLLEERGMSTRWAIEAHGAMVGCGLTDVTTVTDARTYTGGTGICQLHHSNSHQLQDQLIAHGMTQDQLTRLRQTLQDERLVLSSYLMHSTTGRRPADA